MTGKEPLLKWKYVNFDWLNDGGHIHILESRKYKGLRHHWSRSGHTGERWNRFYIGGIEYPTLREAVKAWKTAHRKRIEP